MDSWYRNNGTVIAQHQTVATQSKRAPQAPPRPGARRTLLPPHRCVAVLHQDRGTASPNSLVATARWNHAFPSRTGP